MPAFRQAPVVALLLLAGCGSATTQTRTVRPHLPRALAHDWARQADAVAAALAAGDGCLARQRAGALQASVIAAKHRIGPRFQEPLTSAVNDLAGRITCTPPAPSPQPAPPGQNGRGHADGHDRHGDHGKHKGHGT